MTATVACPNGHESTDNDYCSTCGTRIDGTASVPAAAVDDPGPAGAAPAPADAPAQVCPNCSTDLDPGSRFCEVCGYDPSTGSLPQAPVVQPAAPAADAAPAD